MLLNIKLLPSEYLYPIFIIIYFLLLYTSYYFYKKRRPLRSGLWLLRANQRGAEQAQHDGRHALLDGPGGGD